MIYLCLTYVVIILTPLLNTLLYSFFGVTREQLPYIPTPTLPSWIVAVFLGNIVGVEEPLFPFLATTFLGTIIGIILGQSEEDSDGYSGTALKRITLLGITVVASGLAYWAIVDKFAPITPYIIAPIWFIIFNSGMQVLTVSLALRLFDYEPNEKIRYRRIRHIRPVRRAGLLSLSVFMYQFIDIIPRIILTLITPYDFYHLHTIDSIYIALMLFTVVVFYWMAFLRAWERVGFGGSMERAVGSLLGGKNSKKDPTDPLGMKKSLYAPEIPIGA